MKKIILGLILGLFIVCVNNVSAATNLTSCQGLASNTYYVLQNDVTHEGSGTCWDFSDKQNVTLDGNGYTLHIWFKDWSARGIGYRNSTNTVTKNLIVNITGVNESLDPHEGESIFFFGPLDNTTNITNVVVENIIVYGNNHGLASVFFDYWNQGYVNNVVVRNIVANDLHGQFWGTNVIRNGTFQNIWINFTRPSHIGFYMDGHASGRGDDNVTFDNVTVIGNANRLFYVVNGTNFLLNDFKDYTNTSVSNNFINVNNLNIENSYFGGIYLENVGESKIFNNYLFSEEIVLHIVGNSDYNQIWNNTFDTGVVEDYGTGNVYCVDGIGNEYINGAYYSGSDPNCGSCECPPTPPVVEVDSCRDLVTSNTIYILMQDIVDDRNCFAIRGNNITLDGNGHTVKIENTTDYVTILNIFDSTDVNVDNIYFNLTGVGTIIGINNVANLSIKNSDFYAMNCSDMNTGISTSGDITNLYLTGNIWHICGSHYFHVEDSGNVYNTTTIGDKMYFYNHSNFNPYQSMFWWTNSDLFTFRNNYIEIHYLEYPYGCYGGFRLHGSNIDIRDSVWHLYGSPCQVLQLQNYGTPKGHFSNAYIDNITMKCMSPIGCETTDYTRGLAIYGMDNVTVKNSYFDLYSTPLHYTNITNSLSENNYVKGNYIPYWIRDSENITSKNEKGIIRLNETPAYGNYGYYLLYVYRSYNLYFENFTFDGNNSIYYGMRFRDSNGTINDSYIVGNLSGVDIWDGNIDVHDSELIVLTPVSEYGSFGSLRTRNNAIANLYNVTMNDAENISARDTSQVNVYWQLSVSNPLGALVKIYDSLSNIVSEFSDLTKSPWLREFYVYNDTRTNTTPHTIEATKEDYEDMTMEITMDDNKKITLILSMLDRPDLTFINGMWFTNENPMENESIDITVTVKNVGDETSEETVVKFYDNDQLFATRNLSSLSPDQTQIIVQSFASSEEGLHFIKAVVDPDNDIDEEDEDNNEIIRVVYVGEITEIGNIIVDGSLNPNKGYRGSSVKVYGTAMYNTTFGAGTMVKGAEVKISLLEEEWTTHTNSNGYFSRSITIPMDAPIGINDVDIFVTDFTLTGQTTLYLNVTNITQEPPEPGEEKPDLTIFSGDIYTVPGRLVEGDNATLYVRVRNVGNKDAYNVSVEVYKDGNISINQTIPYIGEGGYQTLSYSMEDIEAGWFTIKVVLDKENEIEEWNENNNVREKGFYVYGPDDIELRVVDIWPSKTPFVQENLTLYVKVYNDGEAEGTNITVRVSDGPETLGDIEIETLGSQEYKTVNVSWQEPSAGWHTIKAHVDFFDTNSEVNENNNIRTEHIYVYSTAPDLRILSEDIHFSNENPEPGEIVTIYVDMTNIGDADASEFVVRISEDFTEYTVTLGEETIDSLAIGEGKTVSVNYSTNLSGSHVIMAEADPYGEIIERYLNNNIATRAIVVKWPCIDEDGDGYGVCPNCNVTNDCTYDGNDCDDNYNLTYPGAPEICGDYRDNDCDNQTDEGYLTVKAILIRVGKGNHPGTKKEPIANTSVRAFNKSVGSCAKNIGTSWPYYEDIWNNCTEQQSCVTDSNGTCRMEISEGDYIVIGNYTENSTVTYGASHVGDLNCGEERHTQLIIMQNARGKNAPGKQTERIGSLLYIIEPEYVLWDNETELYPFVFESLGDWEVAVTVEPPEGFVSDYDSLSEDVNTEIKAVQFYITDIGSDWVPTEITYEIKHKEKEEKIKTKIGVAISKEFAKNKGLYKKGDREKKGFKELKVFE